MSLGTYQPVKVSQSTPVHAELNHAETASSTSSEIPPVSLGKASLSTVHEPFIFVSEETITDIAMRFDAHKAKRMADPKEYVDVDIPVLYSGANW